MGSQLKGAGMQSEETWRGISDHGQHREGRSSPIVFRDPDSFETDRLELGRDAAQALANEGLYPRSTVERRLGIGDE